MTIWPMRIACWTSKATNTHSEYVLHIAFSRQHWLHEGASVFYYTYLACLVTFRMGSSSFPSRMPEIQFGPKPINSNPYFQKTTSLGLILFIHLFPSSGCLFLGGYNHYFPNCRIVLQLSNLSAGNEMKSWNAPLYSFVGSALCYLPYILLIFLVSRFQMPVNYVAQGQFHTREERTEASENYWNVRIWQLLRSFPLDGT